MKPRKKRRKHRFPYLISRSAGSESEAVREIVSGVISIAAASHSSESSCQEEYGNPIHSSLSWLAPCMVRVNHKVDKTFHLPALVICVTKNETYPFPMVTIILYYSVEALPKSSFFFFFVLLKHNNKSVNRLKDF